MTRRIAGWLLLLLMASSGAYAATPVRVSNAVRVEFSFVCQERAEVRAPRTESPAYPAARPAWHSTDAPRARAGVAPALYQRPPPAAR